MRREFFIHRSFVHSFFVYEYFIVCVSQESRPERKDGRGSFRRWRQRKSFFGSFCSRTNERTIKNRIIIISVYKTRARLLILRLINRGGWKGGQKEEINDKQKTRNRSRWAEIFSFRSLPLSMQQYYFHAILILLIHIHPSQRTTAAAAAGGLILPPSIHPSIVIFAIHPLPSSNAQLNSHFPSIHPGANIKSIDLWTSQFAAVPLIKY